MDRLNAIVRPRADLDELRVTRMYELYASYYEAACPTRFRADLAEKHFVIELREGETLRGFSTLALMDFGAGMKRRAIFSGDTIVDHRFWGEQALARAFCRLAGQLRALAPERPLYWFLISKGHRTYRYLSVFSHRYYPSRRGPTPPEVRGWIDELAGRRFGAAYFAELGLVRFPRSQGQLKPQWDGLDQHARTRPEIRFFLQRNPHCHEGDELCCLTALEAGNLRSFARQAFLEGLHDPNTVRLLRRDFGHLAALPRPAAAGADDPAAAPPGAAAA